MLTKETCSDIVIAESFIVIQMSINKLIDEKMWHIGAVEYCSAMKKNELLKCIVIWMYLMNMLSKKSLTETSKYCMILLYEV